MENNLFRLAVGGVCFHNRHIVLLQRNNNAEILPGFWEIPSGGVKRGESIFSALIREVKEEANIDVVVGGLLGYFMYESKNKVPCIQIVHACICKTQCDLNYSLEHQDAKWISLEEIINYHVSDELRQILDTFKISHSKYEIG